MAGDYMQGSKDDAVAVPFSDDDSDKPDDLLADDSPDASVEERVNRKQKRTERIKRLLDEGKQNKEEVARLRPELDSLKGEINQLKGFVQASQRAPASGAEQADPIKKRLDEIYEEQSQAYSSAQAEVKSGTFDEKRGKYYDKLARQLDEEKGDLLARRAIARTEPARQISQARSIWEQKYPEVYQNPNAYNFTLATVQRRLAKGEKHTNELNDEAFVEAMNEFKLGAKKAPSESERARFTGVGGSGGGGSGSGGGIVMSDAMKRMAEAQYSDLPQAEAHKKWASKTGKRMREKKLA